MLSRDSDDEFEQDLCLNFWYGLKKLDELNPRVCCAFGNVFIMEESVTPLMVSPIYPYIGNIHVSDFWLVGYALRNTLYCVWAVLKLDLKREEECDWKEIPRLPLTNPWTNRSDRRLRRGNGLGWEPDGQLLIARWAMAQRVLGVNPKVLYIRRWNRSLS